MCVSIHVGLLYCLCVYFVASVSFFLHLFVTQARSVEALRFF
jgi:hypothetical protein